MLISVLQVQSFVSPAASRLLLALPKSNQKARHRTRWSDSHRANRTALRFSASRGRSDSTVPVLLRDRGDPSPRPYGRIPRSLRCSAPRTAPVVAGIRASLHCVRRKFASTQNMCEPLLLNLLLRQDAAQNGAPCGAASVRRKKPEGWRARCAPVRCRHTDVPSADRRSTLAKSEAMDGRRPRHRGCVSLVTFFAQAKKVTRSPQASGSSALQDRKQGTGLCAASCRAPFGPFAARMFAPASCLRSPACAGMTSEEGKRPSQRKRRAKRSGQLRASWRNSCALARLTGRRVPSVNSATTWPVSWRRNAAT